jgi:hypothetical protein
VAVEIGRSSVLVVGVVPAIRAAAPAPDQVGVMIFHAGIEIGHHNALPGKASIPERRGIDHAQVLLGCTRCAAGACRRLERDLGRDLRHQRRLRQFVDHRRLGRNGDRVLNPQRGKRLNLALALALLQQVA